MCGCTECDGESVVVMEVPVSTTEFQVTSVASHNYFPVTMKLQTLPLEDAAGPKLWFAQTKGLGRGKWQKFLATAKILAP